VAAVQRADEGADIEMVAVNDIADAVTLAHLLPYDSILGRPPKDVTASTDEISIDGVVLESTGLFTKHDAAARHLDAGAKR
jgi:glyceraldehyde 3-phosphate dehydrogenase